MNVFQKIEYWGDRHHPAWLDIVRIGLGVFLFIKGIGFISDTTRLTELVNGLKIDLWPVMAVHYVAFVHIFGGFLIALGVLTRLSCLLQIPNPADSSVLCKHSPGVFLPEFRALDFDDYPVPGDPVLHRGFGPLFYG